ncbi:MAG: sulfotransferase [Calditrichaceae bacterium]|nr:sulfotransferase [Calditrichaceae bacterium]MBN2709342.1 sulfotransferase [Calditrichaceae bacterium]RQV94674.1 MAG: sulfotransferase family protein [Calditrichota bacterium]
MINELIIVSGLPRSGTSLMMQILKAGGIDVVNDGLRTEDEFNPAGYFEDNRVKSLDKENAWLKSEKGKAIKIISYALPYIPAGLPVKVIFMLRNPDEIILSQNRMLKNNTGKMSDENLKHSFNTHLNKVFLWMNEQKFLQYITVSYHDLLNNALAEIKRINRFLNLSLQEEEACQAIKPELYRSRKL